MTDTKAKGTAWRDALGLFDEFLNLTSPEIDQRLQELEIEQPETARCLRSLLEHDRPDEEVLDQPVGQILGELLAENPSTRDATGRMIGRYRLLRQIGRGGMGVVYEAERADGEFEQRVAVKLLRWSADSESADARFSRERRILARLEHPGIARLLDGGKSAEGRPYLVMELVAGRPLDAYCDEERLSIEDRLRLFIEICHVVHYAHRQLVVHRDLKPSNILVDQEGRVRLLDFGIAKLLSEDQDDGLTKIGQRIMTPEFAAPEQIEGGRITTATDVYTLGLILFELLTGRRPRTAAPGSGVHTVPRPSTLITSKKEVEGETPVEKIAGLRGLTPRRLRGRIKGELDLIVLKALRYDPEERYVSADAFADDIQRHLEGFPIRARPANLVFRTRSFLRRNRGPVAAGLAVLFALALGLVSTLRQVQERTRQANIAEGVSDFLVELLEGSEPLRAGNAPPSALELLERGAHQLEENPDTPQELRARLMEEIGTIYLHFGDFRQAAHFSGRGLLEAQQLYGPNSSQASSAEAVWGASLWKLGRYREAESALRHALLTQRKISNDTEAGETLSALGALFDSLGRFTEAEDAHRQALDISRKVFGPYSEEAGTDLQNLAVSLWHQGRLSESETAARESLKIRVKRTGKDSASTAGALHTLATTLSDEGNFDEAESCFREAARLREEIYGPEHPDLALSLSGLSAVLMREGRQEDAINLAERTVAISRKIYGPAHADVATQLNNLGKRYYSVGKFKKAEERISEAREIWKKTLPDDHPNITTALSNLGMIRFAEGDLKGAEQFLREALARERGRRDPSPARLCLCLCNLGRVLDADKRSREALSLLERAQEKAEDQLDPEDSLHDTIKRHLSEIAAKVAEEH